MSGSRTVAPPATVAVTGANGFIGAHCVLHLLAEGYTVRAVVRDPSNVSKTEFLKTEAQKINKESMLSFHKGDLSKHAYDDAFKGCEAVVHTAAVVEVVDKSNPVEKIINPSVEGTRNVLDSIKAAGTVKRYVHASSCIAVQSMDKPEEYVFTEKDWNEWSTVENGDPYGVGKTRAEKLIWEDGALEGCDVVAINPVVVLGPVLCKAHTKASTVLLRQIIYNNSMLNYNCSFVDVRDVAKAVGNSLTCAKAAGERFLIVQGPPMNTIELVDVAQKACPKYKLDASPSVPSWQLTLVSALASIPLIGSYFASEFDLLSLTKLIRFDNTKSTLVLGVRYRDLETTVADTIESMKPFIKVKEKKV